MSSRCAPRAGFRLPRSPRSWAGACVEDSAAGISCVRGTLADTRSIAVLSTGRQDYGILRSTLLQLHADPRFVLRLYVGGMHLRERFGRSVQLIQRDQLPIARELDFLSEPPNQQMDAGRALTMVAEVLETDRPQSLVLV